MDRSYENSENNEVDGGAHARGRGRGIRVEQETQLRRPHQPAPSKIQHPVNFALEYLK